MDVFGNLISKEDIQLVRSKLLELKNQRLERYQRNIKAISYVNYLFKKMRIKAIIVGGHAVELYTAGHYSTVDIDLVLAKREQAKEILEAVGFTLTPDLRHWYHEELGIPVEIPDHTLAGSEDKIIELETEEGFSVSVIGFEDLILDRARSAYYWKHEEDRHWALSLIVAHKNDLDIKYLENTAQAEDKELYSFIKDLIEEAEKRCSEI